ncbi:pentapeptide repeat-containing protein [Streptomyces sp. NBC_00193]|uniref:pentapeptide repeat-containing protein n=1 Tax=Streptomyces sp. NBC_00193 TaxID=2975675 RepID=UPI0022562ABE|nr:pentapeptide repeat-containing protein [Streptomyces sp. NBC_00193]MCX5301641.1 pentapeptide repeat-containing protein [Streptomyces sp. NBC_00193]
MSAVAVAGFTWTSITQVNNEQAITREGQITDRYTAAVENLGNKNSENVRLGGIYALQRIMQDSPRDQPTVTNVLASFIRSQSTKPKPKSNETASDITAAAKVLASRNIRHDVTELGNLPPGYTLETFLWEAQRRVDLEGADLHGISLERAQLAYANLRGANLSETWLPIADLSRAILQNANLTSAALSRADLSNASLHGANLKNAILSEVDFTCANLSGADLQYARPGDPYQWGAITREQVLSAKISPETKLPTELATDPAMQKHMKSRLDQSTCPKE